MLTDDELAAIEARANAATPGQWLRDRQGAIVHWDRDEERYIHLGRMAAPRQRGGGKGSRRATAQEEANAAFVCFARDDVPALVEEVRRLREVERIAVETLNMIASDNCGACVPGARDLPQARTMADDALTRMDTVE